MCPCGPVLPVLAGGEEPGGGGGVRAQGGGFVLHNWTVGEDILTVEGGKYTALC